MAGHPAPGDRGVGDERDQRVGPKADRPTRSAPCPSNRGPTAPGDSLLQGPRSDPVSCRGRGRESPMGLFFADPLFEDFAVSFGLGLGGQLGEVAAICAQIGEGDNDAWYTAWS